MENLATEWQIQNHAKKITSNNSSREAIENKLMNKIWLSLDHEKKVKSKGKETMFRRNTGYSEEFSRKFRIMTMLQSNGRKKTHSKNDTRSEQEFEKTCQNLTSYLLMNTSECLGEPCDPAAPYRTIDGCCNNLESPTQGLQNVFHSLY